MGSTVQDKVITTGDNGHVFLKLDGAIHPITVFPKTGKTSDIGDKMEKVVVVGHCCESGDLMTPEAGEPESLDERLLREANIGDILIMDGSGAYCSAMSTKNYNSFPEAPEVLVHEHSEKVFLIRERQTLQQIYHNEKQLS